SYTGEEIVCPEDRTMLLAPVTGPSSYVDQLTCWFAGPWEVSHIVCPKCNRKNPKTLFGRCVKDGGIPETKTRVIEPAKPAPLHEAYEPVEFFREHKLTLSYLANDIPHDRPVMVHLMRSNLTMDFKTAERFVSGATKAVELVHPAIYKTYEVRTLWDEGQLSIPYIVGEVLDKSGTCIAEMKGKLAESEFVQIMMQVFAALEYAHGKETMHGNLTTNNIYAHKTDNGWNVKILEFGMAERLLRDLQWDGPSRPTGTVNVYGEATVLSPEILKGDRPSAASEVYALGCVMYEMLAGRAPLLRENEILTMFAHMSDAPEPFDQSLNIPDDLASIVFRCLKKDPKDRFNSVADLREKIEKYQHSKK
ncbi:MAG: serine/threonine protein kinase, partial [Cyanobacteria bacterium]|nr:serine/threonine protein kinase [Cyanobacteriota bacterium]